MMTMMMAVVHRMDCLDCMACNRFPSGHLCTEIRLKCLLLSMLSNGIIKKNTGGSN